MISVKSNKFSKIFYPIFYVLFSAALVLSACFIFDRNYYTNIYVSGSSMKPTLMGDVDVDRRVHYGIADTSYYARTHLKRFDVVVAYFPESWLTGPSLKVKRIWGFPGERIVMTVDDGVPVFTVTYGDSVEQYVATKSHSRTYTFEKYDENNNIVEYNQSMNVYTMNNGYKTFDLNATPRTFDITLAANQYFLMGDNWGSSTDSYEKRTSPDKIGLEHIQGRVVCIQGTAEFDSTNKVLVRKKSITPKYLF